MTGELMALAAMLIGLSGVLLGASASKRINTLDNRVRQLEESATKD
jgi:hypothetical protein